MFISSIRYSVDRKKEYQIKTVIFEKNNVKYVSKEPYSKTALKHINKIYDNYELLNESSFNLVRPELHKNKIVFPFIEGNNFASLLIKDVSENNLDDFKNKLIWYKFMLMKEEQISYDESNEFKAIFGEDLYLSGAKCFKVSNIDLNFENLIVSKEKQVTVIDYEWVFNFPIPIEYVLYRALIQFTNRYARQLNKFISLELIFKIVGINQEDIATYEKMEKAFSSYVGGGWSQQRVNYFKEIVQKNKCIENNVELIDLNEPKESIQVFWSGNNSFNEADSKLIEVRTSNAPEFYELELPTTPLQNLRIDPGESPAYVVMEITLEWNQQKVNLINKFTSFNGIRISYKDTEVLKFINTTNDPQLIFSNLDLKAGNKSLKIKMLFLNNVKDSGNALIDELEKNRKLMKDMYLTNENYKQELDKSEEKLKETEKDLQNKTTELIKIKNIYREIIATKGWRFLEIIRKLKIK